MDSNVRRSWDVPLPQDLAASYLQDTEVSDLLSGKNSRKVLCSHVVGVGNIVTLQNAVNFSFAPEGEEERKEKVKHGKTFLETKTFINDFGREFSSNERTLHRPERGVMSFAVYLIKVKKKLLSHFQLGKAVKK